MIDERTTKGGGGRPSELSVQRGDCVGPNASLQRAIPRQNDAVIRLMRDILKEERGEQCSNEEKTQLRYLKRQLRLFAYRRDCTLAHAWLARRINERSLLRELLRPSDITFRSVDCAAMAPRCGTEHTAGSTWSDATTLPSFWTVHPKRLAVILLIPALAIASALMAIKARSSFGDLFGLVALTFGQGASVILMSSLLRRIIQPPAEIRRMERIVCRIYVASVSRSLVRLVRSF